MAGLREQIARSPVRVGDSRLHDYLLIQLNDAPTERLHAIFVDSVSDYIADEQIACLLYTSRCRRQQPATARSGRARDFDKDEGDKDQRRANGRKLEQLMVRSVHHQMRIHVAVATFISIASSGRKR